MYTRKVFKLRLWGALFQLATWTSVRMLILCLTLCQSRPTIQRWTFIACRRSCYHYKFILNHFHFKLLGFSAVMHLQCHMWARLHFKVHPSSSFRIVGQSSHFSANTSCSVKLTCHLNSFIPRPLN